MTKETTMGMALKKAKVVVRSKKVSWPRVKGTFFAEVTDKNCQPAVSVLGRYQSVAR